MSPPAFTEERQGGPQGTPSVMDQQYVMTEDELRVMKECYRESFWYRCVPFSVTSIAVTQALVVKGILSSSGRFGSLPKVVFAGFFGYLAGRLSYMQVCQEKFKRLQNSPVGEALRQRTGKAAVHSVGPQSEMSDPDSQSFDPMFQASAADSQIPPAPGDFGQGYGTEPPQQTSRGDDFNPPAQSYVEEEEPRRRPILYEDLRIKNRENYEVTLTQKAETLLKPAPEREAERPALNTDAKKNIYGDTWEE